MSKKVLAMKVNKSKVIVYIKGITHEISTSQEGITTEVISNIVNEVKRYQSAPTDDLYNEILKMVDPMTYITVLNGDFERSIKGVRKKGTNVDLPKSLLTRIETAIEEKEDYEYLLNFWDLCLLNDNARARNDLFSFLDRNGLIITPKGYFVTYKAVHVLEGLSELDRFVASEVMVVRSRRGGTLMGRDPWNYIVVLNDGKYETLYEPTQSGTGEGNLGELYQNLTADIEQDKLSYRLTDKHTKKMNIRLGVPVHQDEVDTNPGADCSIGLHVGSPSYVKNFAQGNDMILICLVNPMHVKAVPEYDTSKMRVCEYLPIGVTEKDTDGNIVEIETDYFEDDYEHYTRAQIKEMLSDMDNSPDTALQSMDALRAIIQKRITQF